MKIPLIWLKDYVDTGKNPKEIADSFTRIGLMLDKPVGDDGVLDLEQRLNRSDLLSILGCARDLAVFEKIKLKEPKVKIHKSRPATLASKIAIKVETPSVRRFSTRVFQGVKVKPSPDWLRERLELYGIESKNNIVDITNFVMVEYGQTTHAQDISKFKGRDITIRNARKGEKLVTLLGTEVELDDNTFILTSGGVPTVIGGIVGGKVTGVTESTTEIILDAGNYDPRIIRKNSRKLKIFNESVSRNDKMIDPRLCEIALNRATDLILELAGGEYFENDDYYPSAAEPQSISLTAKRLKLISGQDISLRTAKTILKLLGYAVTDESIDRIVVEVPYYRTDLEVEDDLVSDILRMLDYNTIPSLALKTPIPKDITPDLYKFEDKLRDYMVALGAHEHITTQLVLNDGNQDRVVLENALSEDQNSLRMSALETLSSVSDNYAKHGINDAVIFEIGKSFKKKDYTEIRELAVIDTKDIRSTLASLLQNLGIDSYLLEENDGNIAVKYGNTILGILNKISFVLYTPVLQSISSTYPRIISEFTHRTSIDISVSYPIEMHFSDIIRIARTLKESPSAIEVLESYQEWKLVRFTWDKRLGSADQTRKELVAKLKSSKVATRSE